MSIMLEDVFERTAKIISKRAGVAVIFRGNSTPRTTGKEIILPSLPSPCPDDVLRAAMGSLDHECSHCLFSDFRIIRTFKARWGEGGFLVLNCLEDIRVDVLMEKAYPGARDNLARSYADCLLKWKENIDQISLWGRVLGCVIATGKIWDLNLYGEDARRIVSLVGDLVMKAPSAKNTRAIARLAEQVLDRWKDVLYPNEEQENTNEASQTTVNGRQRPLERSLGSEVASVRSDTSQEGEATTETDPLRESIKTLFETEPSDEAPNLGRYLQTTLTELPTGGRNMPYRVFSTADDVVETAPDIGIESYNRLMDEVRPHVSTLRQKLLLTLRAKAQSRWVPDQNGHRLDRRRLHTLCLDVPSPPPFVSRREGSSQDVAFSLLVDQSGSMQGEKISLARQCAALLAHTLDRLGLPSEVIGFTTVSDRRYLGRFPKADRDEIEAQFARYIPTRHIIYKCFAESFRRSRGRIAFMEALAYTPLNESVMFAGRRMLSVKASRRVLVVLTDGAPFLGSQEMIPALHENLRRNIGLLAKAGIETVAVGVQAPYVEQVFERSIVINQITEMPTQFYQLMSSLLLRGLKAAA